jgi:DNA-binding NarL/FixJ family response regulator
VKAMSNKQIASCLEISDGTVKRHLTNIYAKLGVSSRADAAKQALTSGLITFRDLSEPGGRR